MIIRHITTIIILLISISMAGYGQSKKKIREEGISSRTVQEYFIEEGMDEPLVESIEKYDREGELIEVQELNRRGEVRKWEKYVYDEEGELVEEIFLDVKGRIERTEKNIFKDGLRVEKEYYNNRGQLYKRKVYVYEHFE